MFNVFSVNLIENVNKFEWEKWELRCKICLFEKDKRILFPKLYFYRNNWLIANLFIYKYIDCIDTYDKY